MSNKPKLKPRHGDKAATILLLFDGKRRDAEIAEIVGCSPQYVRKVARYHAVDPALRVCRPKKPPRQRTPQAALMLTPAERADYDTFKRAGYLRAEALAAIGRADLIDVRARVTP